VFDEATNSTCMNTDDWLDSSLLQIALDGYTCTVGLCSEVLVVLAGNDWVLVKCWWVDLLEAGCTNNSSMSTSCWDALCTRCELSYSSCPLSRILSTLLLVVR
jgi:hypothetical protein